MPNPDKTRLPLRKQSGLSSVVLNGGKRVISVPYIMTRLYIRNRTNALVAMFMR